MLLVVVVGERLGLVHAVTRRVSLPVWVLLVGAGGWPVFARVARAAARGRVTAHTLMTVGVAAAAAVGEWAAAAVVVFFMRVGDFVERFTTERARQAVAHLARLAPQTARVERGGEEVTVPAGAVQPGEVVVVRPGEAVPVDGEVVEGVATVDQSPVTGESMPTEAGPGSRLFAASVVRSGYLRVRATAVGPESTFGRVVRLVREAEANRSPVQQAADRFSGYYLPVVAAVAVLTFLARRDPLAAAAVLAVACSCSFALATPVAVLATVGALARHGVLVKGGRYLRSARAVAEPLGIPWRARLLPEDKIQVVRRYQEQSRVVVMVGDGVNDAPALAQAHVGIATGSAGTAVAAEVAGVVLLRDDWTLVPRAIRLARRAVRTVWLNLFFTAAYNLAGLSLAALGLLPLPLAAAAQSLPDLFILGNSSRLIRGS